MSRKRLWIVLVVLALIGGCGKKDSGKSAPGSPPVIAAPVESMFQTDKLAIRMVFEMSWALRSASGLAWMQNVKW